MNKSCPIWKTPASIKPPTVHGSTVDSPRTGGMYSISSSAQEMLIDLDKRSKSRLTSWLIEQRRQGTDCPKLYDKEINHAKISRDLSVHIRADNLLRFIRVKVPHIGARISYHNLDPEGKEAVLFWEMLAYSESINHRELDFLLDYLADRSWLTVPIQSRYSTGCRRYIYELTVQGYEHLAEIDHTATDSSQAFVAMWFHESMNDIWENGFRLAIEDAGYKPVRIDQKEHVNKIDDEIIAEIRRSRFLVADFTQGRGGARGGVYYEAGFARGLAIPVIFTCRKDVLRKIHFDVRQFNTIVWEKNKMSELRENLRNRISAVIGDGPLRN